MSHAEKGGRAPDQASSGRQTGVAALPGRIIRKARNAASHPTSHKQHDNNQAGNGPRQTDSTESHSHPKRLTEHGS
jgi:hypothetical protein